MNSPPARPVAAALGLLMLAGCSLRQAAPIAQEAAPTLTAEMRQELPVPPPTSTPTPAVTPRPTATRTPTPSPTPQPVASYCPHRGVEPQDPTVLLRRPILVRFGNSEPERPQSGLLEADVVVESLSEGRITRLDGLYQCHEAELVGNIRSARLINLELSAMWRAVLAYSGASQPVQQRIWDSGIYEVGAWPTERGYLRVSFRAAPFNMYTSTEAIRDEARSKGIPLELEEPLPAWPYDAAPPPSGQPRSEIGLPYANWSAVRYEYQARDGVYHRYQAGTLTVDAQTRRAIPVANVAAVWVSHTPTDIIEDALGSRSLFIDLKGRGRAMLFRDGRAYEAEWVRREAGEPLVLVDPQGGEPLPLKPGLTWINLVPLELSLE